jgi:hypothetical protein
MKFVLLLFVACFFAFTCADSLQERRVANIQAAYATLLYPLSYATIINHTSAYFFHPNITGRINTVGMYNGRQESVEYFYALGNPVSPTIVPGQLRVVETTFRVLDIVGTRASVQVNIRFATYPSNDTHHNLTHIGWLGFRPDDDRISFYDLTILRLGQYADLPPAAYPASISALCNAQNTNCQGANQQFPSVSDCIDFMSSLTFGSWNNAYSDTVICRILHNFLTVVRPEYHCAHVGPTGGGKCIEHPYEDWYNHEFIANLGTDSP